MKCEICQKEEAAIRIKNVQAGKLCELFVCESCARASSKEAHASPSLSTLLAGLAFAPDAPPVQESVRCARCGMGLSEMYKRRQFGCAECYEHLAEHMLPMIEEMQGCLEHRGKVPSRERATAGMLEAEQAMSEAVQKQDFETAARLRDKLKALREGIASGSTGRKEESSG